DCRGREAVPGEGELERRDVPSATADCEVALSERAPPPVAAEGLTGARSQDAVRGEGLSALEPAKRLLRVGAENPVDRPFEQVVRPEADLERGDVRIPCTGGA